LKAPPGVLSTVCCTATAVHVIVGIRPSTRNTYRCCSACTRSGAAPRHRQPNISGDDHDWGVIAQASGTASSSVRWLSAFATSAARFCTSWP